MPALSVGEAIGDLAVAAVEALGITDGGKAVDVKKRKVPALPSGVEPPQIVVVVQEDRTEPYSGTERLKTYTLAVVIIRAGGRKLAVDPVVQGWRQQIERKLDDRGRDVFVGLPAGARFQQSDCVGGKAPFDMSGLPKDIDWSALAFSVQIIETRATS